MKAIVSGANGFIGTALCKSLSKQGHQVYAIVKDDKEYISEIEKFPNVEIITCELAEYRNLSSVIVEREFDIFYHLAWIGSAGTMRGDIRAQIDNVQYTCSLVQTCIELKCKRIVFASSIMEYEVIAAVNSDLSLNKSSIYSIAKLSADYFLKALANSEGIEYIRAVISNIYGPGENSPRLINTSIRKLLKGEHCAFSPGEQIYDFIYIDDAAQSFVAIGKKGVNNKTYYIGSRKPRPLKEFLVEMNTQICPNNQIGLGELEFEGVSLMYNEFDIDAIYKDTGFTPKYSFSEGIKNTIEWIKENE